MTSAENKAVFLSYASQDAPAVERIAEALRAADVEVWFDKNELTGGDAWDAKIRGQIASCALFVPVISAATQARGEGYFRLEWKLAVDRSHLMAHDQPFLLPVVVDATADAAARVPPEFRAVQWTRLPGGETPEKFCARVKTLLGGEGRDASPRRPSGRSDETPGRLGETSLPPKAARSWLIPAITGGAVLVALALWQPWKNSAPAFPPRPAAVAPSALALTPAQQLVAKARTILDQGDELNRETYALAEELLIRAEAIDVTEASAWVLHASVSRSRIEYGLDRSAARFEALRNQTGRAVQLAPESLDTQLAECGSAITFEQNIPEVINRLQALAVKYPDDWRVPEQLSHCYLLVGKSAEGLAANERALQLSPENPRLKSNRINFLIVARRWAEAEASIAVMLRGRTGTRLLAHAVYLKLLWSGDLAGAASAVRSWPAWFLLEDRGVGFAAWVALWNRDPGGTLEVVRKFPRDYIRDYAFTGPTAVLSAWANEQAGNAESARADWRIVQQVAERELRAAPNDADALHCKAWALARLGDIPAATSILQQLLEKNYAMSAKGAMGQFVGRLGGLALAVGRTDLALAQIAQNPPGGRAITQTDLRLNPLFDPLRSDPRFQAAIAAALGPAEKKESGVTSAVTPNDKSVAVLAFANLSDDKANEYFSDGISEELLTVLQKIPGLRVAARTSAFSFKGKNSTAQEIGTTLNVAHLVEGSVQKSGNRVKISARLSRVTTGEQLWSENFTRDLADVFAVQSEIAQTIVERLRGQLTGEVAASTKAEIQLQVQTAEKGGTRNAEAHELFLQGRFLGNQGSSESMNRAVALLQRAVELDPQFAQAWAELSHVATLLSGFGTTREEIETAGGGALARRAADRALAIEPNLVAAQLARGGIQFALDFDWVGGAETVRRAQRLAPSDPGVVGFAALMANATGRLADAEKFGREAISLDPINPVMRILLGRVLTSTKRFAEAEAEFRRMNELNPQNAWAHAGLADVFVLQGKYAAAVAEAQQGPAEWARLYVLARAHWGLKQTAEADAALERLTTAFGDTAVVQIAAVHAFRGQSDRAFEWLDRAYVLHDSGLAWSKANMALAPLHADPRWPVFLKKIGLSDEQLK